MKDRIIIITMLILTIVHFAVLIHAGLSDEQERMEQAWMDGYRQQQIENLPEIGIEKHKGPADLLGKG